MFVSLKGYQLGCSKLLWKHNLPYELFCSKKLFEYQNTISICYGWVACSIIVFYYTNGPNLWIHCNGLKQLRNCFLLSSNVFKTKPKGIGCCQMFLLLLSLCTWVWKLVWPTLKLWRSTTKSLVILI
jgi:hypothetical protein